MSNVWLKQYAKKRIAVVVAHPDDEVLWFGGLLDWARDNAEYQYLCGVDEPVDVICCSIPETEPERAIKFQEACRYLECRYKLLPFIEVRGGHLVGLEHLSLVGYDVVFTHNAAGEYGHVHHIDVHEAVMRKFDGPVFVSGYGIDGGTPITFNWEEKLAAITYYNHMSKVTGGPKYKELLARWGSKFDLQAETYKQIRG